jgi:DNA-binding CsgD family transcriptional regulator
MSTLGYALLMVTITLADKAFPALHSTLTSTGGLFGPFNSGRRLFIVALFAGALLSHYCRSSCLTRQDRQKGPSPVLPLFMGFASLAGALLLVSLELFETYAHFVAWLAGALTGVGNAGLCMFWMKLFANQDVSTSAMEIIIGSALAGILCLLLSLLTAAPLAIIHICIIGISVALLLLCISDRDFSQQAETAVRPRSLLALCRDTIATIWKQALCVASFAFAWGSVSAAIPSDFAVTPWLTDYSSVGRIVSAAILFVLWHGFSRIHTDLEKTYQTAFPFVATLFVLLPFFGEGYMVLFALFLYLVFGIASMLMMITCVRAAREQGIQPVFVYGVFGGIVYTFRSAGLHFGSSSYIADTFSLSSIIMVTLLCVYFFFIVAVITRKRQKTVVADTDCAAIGTTQDTLSEQCALLAEKAALSARETEIIELVARGRTVPAISNALFVSKNTVQTHNKNIYRKLGIHSKQELLDLLEQCDS